jgi:hypothetical protein
MERAYLVDRQPAAKGVRVPRPLQPHEIRFFVDLVARRASPETVVELATRSPVSRTSVVAGRTKRF